MLDLTSGMTYDIAHLDGDGSSLTILRAQATNPFQSTRHQEPVVLVRGEDLPKPIRKAMHESAQFLFPTTGVVMLPASVRQVEVVAVAPPTQYIARLDSDGNRLESRPQRYNIEFLTGRMMEFDCPVLGKSIPIEIIGRNPWRPNLSTVVYLDSDLDRLLSVDELGAVGDAIRYRFAIQGFIALCPYNVRFARARLANKPKPDTVAGCKKTRSGRRQ